MNEINKYNASEMLTQYMDGELDPSMIPAFENELSTNSELQSEYREMLAIREAVQKDVKKLVPPYETTATLFESLGISYTSSIATSSSVGMTVWQQLMMPLVASLSAALLTIGATFGIDFFKDAETNTETVRTTQQISNKDNKLEKSEAIIEDKLSNELEESTIVENLSESKEVKPITNTTNNRANKFSNIITPKSSKINNDIIAEPIESKEIKSNNPIIEQEIFNIFPSEIITNNITIDQSNIGSKLNYNYNNQKFERYSSGMNFNTIAGGGSLNQIRIALEYNLSSSKFFDNTINSIGINFSTNLFSDTFASNNFVLAADLRHEFKGLINNFTPVILAGTGYDFNSKSPILRYGIAGIVNLPNNFQLEGRYEINSLTNQNINLQQLNYTKNNQGQVVILIKYNF